MQKTKYSFIVSYNIYILILLVKELIYKYISGIDFRKTLNVSKCGLLEIMYTIQQLMLPSEKMINKIMQGTTTCGSSNYFRNSLIINDNSALGTTTCGSR